MPLPTKNRTLTLSKTPGNEDPPGKVWYPLKVHETPVPTPSTSTQLLLHPTHVALNHRDVFLRQHLYPAPAFDSTPMFSDAVAQVINKDGSDAGRRVLLNPGHGWEKDEKGPEKAYGIVGGTKTNPLGLAADYVLVEEVETAHCPEHLSGVEAAALPLCGLTGWRALVTKSGAAERGSNILVTGIGGGVALMVLLFAVKMGVNVWVSSGDEGKIAKAKELGAKGGVNYKTKGWEKELLGMLPKEKPMLDAIIDGAGGDVGDKAARLLKVCSGLRSEGKGKG
jgi:NADPH:quinone reductase-like Zn-dependent oxidoreductase